MGNFVVKMIRITINDDEDEYESIDDLLYTEEYLYDKQGDDIDMNHRM